MSDLNKSDSLCKLLEKAENLGRQKSVTAEKLLVAALAVVKGTSSIPSISSEEISDVFKKRNIDINVLLSSVTAYVESHTETFSDIIYIRKIMSDAGKLAEQDNKTELSVVHVLVTILDSPNPELQEIIKKSTIGGTAATTGSVTGSVIPPSGSWAAKIASAKAGIFLGGAAAAAAAAAAASSVPKSGEPAEKTPEPPATPEDAKEKLIALTKRVSQIRDELAEEVLGQNNAISKVVTGYYSYEYNRIIGTKQKGPGAIFLFAGPPGVGKTFLAEQLGDKLGMPFERFDMSEFDLNSSGEFSGVSGEFSGRREGKVTGYAKRNPRSVMLFDEIEKADLKIIHLFLQILDAGQLHDGLTGQEVSFKDIIVIMTTNVGRDLYESHESDDMSGVPDNVVLDALRKEKRPNSEESLFPEAICSRMAKGSIIMFNRMSAHHLRNIAKVNIEERAESIKKSLGLDISIDEDVYSAILLAQGSRADARITSSKSKAFLENELYEFNRLLSIGEGAAPLSTLEKLDVTIDMTGCNPEIHEFFEGTEKYTALCFASPENAALCKSSSDAYTILHADSIDEAEKIIRESNIDMVLFDPDYGIGEKAGYLNIEDEASLSRDFIALISEKYPYLPVYMLETPSMNLSREEQFSYERVGVKGFLSLKGDKEQFDREMLIICKILHQQSCIVKLGQANKILSYSTAQLYHPENNAAEIRLYDFALTTAVEAEDKGSLLNNISRPDVSFDQVLGAKEAKKELMYFVDFLKNPRKFMSTGVAAPKGVLMYGPPGTGKTMLAKAMAHEAGVAFIAATPAQFMSKWNGESEQNVSKAFAVARKYAPSILFLDEVDAIARKRTNSETTRNTEELLTVFLSEMDGFKTNPNKPVIVLAATNADASDGSVLDDAFLRRFDRRILVDLPAKEDRMEFLRRKNKELAVFALTEADIETIATKSTSMSLADLASVCELALRNVIRSGDMKVTGSVFLDALETFSFGEARQKYTAEQVLKTARHESGHTFVCWKTGDKPSYVTIVSRGNFGGYMQHGNDEKRTGYTKEEMRDLIRVSLAGRAAEMVYYGDENGLSTGASSDLANATRIALDMMCRYGMDPSFGMAVTDPNVAMNDENSGLRKAVNALLSEELENAKRIISENRDAMDALVDELIKKDHLTGDEIDALLTAALN